MSPVAKVAEIQAIIACIQALLDRHDGLHHPDGWLPMHPDIEDTFQSTLDILTRIDPPKAAQHEITLDSQIR